MWLLAKATILSLNIDSAAPAKEASHSMSAAHAACWIDRIGVSSVVKR